jgi:hypothetical protein
MGVIAWFRQPAGIILSLRLGMHMKYAIALSFFSAFAFLAASAQVSPASSVPAALMEQFKTTRAFTDQFEIAESLVKLHDTAILESLRPSLQD